MHDQTSLHTAGIAEQFRLHPKVKAETDEGYRGLANAFPDQVSAPAKKPKEDAPLSEHHAWREARRRQSSRRICVEHANAEYKQWRPLQHFTGRREDFAEIQAAIASLVSDRSARRVTRRVTRRAPNWCPSARPPADHPPAKPPGRHAPTSIAPQLVSRSALSRSALPALTDQPPDHRRTHAPSGSSHPGELVPAATQACAA
jgi:hypothetical protein